MSYGRIEDSRFSYRSQPQDFNALIQTCSVNFQKITQNTAQINTLVQQLGTQQDTSELQDRLKLALRYHPDKNPDDPAAAEIFKEINRAHSILSDEKKKNIYDSYGSAGLHLASMLGDDGENFMASQSNCCVKLVAYFCTIITCCCCCLCCCYCCGKCLPKNGRTTSFPEDNPMYTDDTNPILVQSFTMNRETSSLNQEFDHSQSTVK